MTPIRVLHLTQVLSRRGHDFDFVVTNTCVTGVSSQLHKTLTPTQVFGADEREGVKIGHMRSVLWLGFVVARGAVTATAIIHDHEGLLSLSSLNTSEVTKTSIG